MANNNGDNNGGVTERTGTVVDVRPPGPPFGPKDVPKDVKVKFDQQGILEDSSTQQRKTFFAHKLALEENTRVYYVDLPVEAPFDAKVTRRV
jgi:hypothetical protein